MMVSARDETDGAGAETASAPIDSDAPERKDPPRLTLILWPNRSLTATGFRRVMILTAVGLTIPVIPFLGTAVGWGLLPFVLTALGALYLAFRRNYRDGRLCEELRLWPDMIAVSRMEPDGRVRHWHANPYWVQVKLHDDARIESYLTLKGNGREIELGAFLSPDERVELYEKLSRELKDAQYRH